MELFCPDCDLRFRKAHDFAIHSKGSKHAAVIEAKRAKEELRKENEWKEQRKDQFREELAPKLQPVFDEYMQSSQATLGPIYVSLCVPVPCASLSESIDCLYQQSRPREHVKERRKCLYKLLFRTIRVLFGPETKLDVYGSIPHKIDDERSDIDMSLQPVKLDVPEAIALDRIAKAIETFVGEEQQQLTVTRVLHARIPVISIRDTLTDTSLDLSMWNVDKMHISEIFSLYFEADPRVRPLVFAVRKVCGKSFCLLF
jgi:DNA polymerase sigma